MALPFHDKDCKTRLPRKNLLIESRSCGTRGKVLQVSWSQSISSLLGRSFPGSSSWQRIEPGSAFRHPWTKKRVLLQRGYWVIILILESTCVKCLWVSLAIWVWLCQVCRNNQIWAGIMRGSTSGGNRIPVHDVCEKGRADRLTLSSHGSFPQLSGR